jgi:hypothetical protein
VGSLVVNPGRQGPLPAGCALPDSVTAMLDIRDVIRYIKPPHLFRTPTGGVERKELVR